MVKWTVNINEELDARFREVVFRVKGYHRGALKEALEEAITMWLEKYEKYPSEGTESTRSNGTLR